MTPDLIILDYMWPGDDAGWPLLQMLWIEPRTAPIPIVLCARAAREVESLPAHLGAMRIQVVPKPFDIDTFAKVIRTTLADKPASQI